MRFIVLAVVCAFASFAQPADRGVTVNISGAPSAETFQKITDYNSGTNPVYICTAASNQPTPSSITVSAGTNASPVALTATAHGFDYQSGATTYPVIKITGATGNWAGLNGVWIATVTGANTFTVPFDSTSAGTFVGQTLTVTTRAPKKTDAVWNIQKFVYDASSNVIWTGWAVSADGAGATVLPVARAAFQFACSSRTTLGYQ